MQAETEVRAMSTQLRVFGINAERAAIYAQDDYLVVAIDQHPVSLSLHIDGANTLERLENLRVFGRKLADMAVEHVAAIEAQEVLDV